MCARLALKEAGHRLKRAIVDNNCAEQCPLDLDVILRGVAKNVGSTLVCVHGVEARR